MTIYYEITFILMQKATLISYILTTSMMPILFSTHKHVSVANNTSIKMKLSKFSNRFFIHSRCPNILLVKAN